MTEKLQILNLEDNPNDYELIRAALEDYGIKCDVVRVETKKEYVAALNAGGIDLILADYSLPGFDGISALDLASGRSTPFVFVSGQIGEEFAIEALKKGATDYVFKNRIDKLGPAVKRAVLEARERAERKAAEEDLRRSRERLRNLSAHLEKVREEERIRIAREIHDELGQALTALKMETAWFRRYAGSKEVSEKAAGMSLLLDSTISSMKKIISQLRPGVLDHLGLVAAMEWQAREFQERTGILLEFVPGIEETEPSAEVATAVFRIFQEALTNIARHAEATKAEASLELTEGKIILTVEDNGRGIRDEQLANLKSFGIIGIRERALFLGGNVTISGHEGKGTILELVLPLDPPPS